MMDNESRKVNYGDEYAIPVVVDMGRENFSGRMYFLEVYYAITHRHCLRMPSVHAAEADKGFAEHPVLLVLQDGR